MDTIAENDDAESKLINISDFHFINANDNALVIELINKVNAIINTKPITRGNIQSSIFNELKRINSDDAHNNLYTQSLILLLNVIILKYSASVEIKSSNVPNFDDITNSEIKTMLKLETNKNKVTDALKTQIIHILELIKKYPNEDLKTKILGILKKIIELRLDRYHVKEHDKYSASETDSRSKDNHNPRRQDISTKGDGSRSIHTVHGKLSTSIKRDKISLADIKKTFIINEEFERIMNVKTSEEAIYILKDNFVEYIKKAIEILNASFNTLKNRPKSIIFSDIINIKNMLFYINPGVWTIFYNYLVFITTNITDKTDKTILAQKILAQKIIVLLSMLIFNFDFKEQKTSIYLTLELIVSTINNIIEEYNNFQSHPENILITDKDTIHIQRNLTAYIHAKNIADNIFKFKLLMIREYLRLTFYNSDNQDSNVQIGIDDLPQSPIPQKNKYLKYKNKYLQLKKILNIN
jgi:hypothetical protein